MTVAQTDAPNRQTRIRLWPGVVALVLQWLGFFVLPVLMPDAILYGIMGAAVCALVILVWWLFFSRAPQAERWGTVALILLAAFATSRLIDKSIAGAMMGFMFPMFSVPVMSLALVLGVVLGHRLADGPRRATIAATILLACGFMVALRTEGITGAGRAQLAWRWTKSHEEKLVAQAGGKLSELPPQPAAQPTAIPE